MIDLGRQRIEALLARQCSDRNPIPLVVDTNDNHVSLGEDRLELVNPKYGKLCINTDVNTCAAAYLLAKIDGRHQIKAIEAAKHSIPRAVPQSWMSF